MTHVYQPHAGGFAYFTSGVINGAIGVGGTWTAYSTLTLPAYTLGGTVTSNGQSFSGTIANLGTVTTVDLNGGTIDGTIIGGAVPAAGTFTTAAATTGNITTVNATTVDTTNIEVTNLKAKDGTAAGSIADATGVVTLGSSVLTTTDINGGTIDGVALGGASAVSLGTPSSGTLTNCTGLPVSTGISGLAANVATFLATPSSANLASAVTDETGSGALVFATSPSFTTPTINTAASVGGSWTAAAAWTLPAFTLGGTVTSNGQSFSGTIANLGTVTTADINGGTIDGAVIGGASAAAGTFEEVNIQSAALGADLSGRYQASGAANTFGQSFLGINAYGWTGAAAAVGGTINFRAAETWSAGAQGTYISLRTVDIGGTTLAERVRVDSTGIQGVIGATTPAAGTFTNGSFTGTLAVDGNVTLGNASTDTLNVGNGGIIKDASGNVGIGVTPSAKLHAAGANTSVGSNDALIQFRTTTAQGVDVGASLQLGGMYDGSNSLGFAEISGRKENSTSGEWGGYLQLSTRQYGGSFAERVRISSAGVVTSTGVHLGPDGSAAAPTYSFSSSGNTDNGMYLSAANVLSFAIAGTKTATIQADRLEFAAGYHVASATATGTTPAIQSGAYTPTLANVTNVSATGEAFGRWLRVGNVVTVSGAVQITPTGTGATAFGISLPIDSDLTADGSSGNGKLNGTIFRSDGTFEGGGISGDVTNNRAQAAIAVTGTSARYFSYHFTYEVLA